MAKISTHVLSISIKHKAGFVGKNFGEVLREYGVDGSLLLAGKLFYSCSEFVSVSVELNHNRSPWIRDDHGAGVPELTPVGVCILRRSRIRSQR